jgi:hypothetical protein
MVGGPPKTPSGNKSERRKPVVDPVPTRRSKRKASKNNPFCPANLAVPVMVAKKKRNDPETKTKAGPLVATKKKRNDSKTKALPRHGKSSRNSLQNSLLAEPTKSTSDNKVPLATTVVRVAEIFEEYGGFPKDQEKDSTEPGERPGLCNESVSFINEWSTPRKRKRIFGKSVDTDFGARVSPELSFLSNRKMARTKAHVGTTKEKDVLASPSLKMKFLVTENPPMTPRMQTIRRKPDFLCKNQSHKRGPVLIEDIFEFNF